MQSNLQANALVEAFLRDAAKPDRYQFIVDGAVDAPNTEISLNPDYQATAKIIALSPQQRVDIVLALIHKQVELGRRRVDGSQNHYSTWLSSKASKALLCELLRKRLPFRAEHFEEMIESLQKVGSLCVFLLPVHGILGVVKQFLSENVMSESFRNKLIKFANVLTEQTQYPDFRRALRKVQELLQEAQYQSAGIQFTTGEAWTVAVLARLESLNENLRTQWSLLLEHCRAASSSKPSKKWVFHAKRHLDSIGVAAFAPLAACVLAEIGKPGREPPLRLDGYPRPVDPTMIHDEHSNLLRGLVWCSGLVEEEILVAALGTAADVCFKKIRGIGPRSPKIGNACVWALSNMKSPHAVAQLSRLKTRAKHASTRKQLAQALAAAAEKMHMSPAELEEMAVPTCGLTGLGQLTKSIADYTARLELGDDSKVGVTWAKAGGKPQRSVPASIKQTHAEEIKSLKRTAKEIERLLPGQRDRLEQLFLQERNWSFAQFRERYLDHPLVATLARRLIWTFGKQNGGTEGIWNNGVIVDRQGRELTGLTDTTEVRLWHPLQSPGNAVRAWREWLEANQVRQPFKQAHREIYVLTDAELQTDIYSNRFAAHIIRQHQFAALCQQRGWRYHLQGQWDSANIPTLELPGRDIRVEFWVEAVPNETAVSQMGIYLYLTTDQVRFYRIQGPNPLPLNQVPPLVFSEVMRDVDLFVGVASVGNDPSWADRGAEGGYRDYWLSYSTAELYPSAQTRKAVLEGIVPRLKLANRCSFDERFLIVRGDLRTYRIHIGSGNILMTPNNQYLCIVPGAGSLGSELFLPFEGDNLLSIILSKALMLAEDTKIKDPTITRQIKRCD
jgi:hypothetical protein